MPPLTRATPKGGIRRRLHTAWQEYMSAGWAAVCMRTAAVASNARTDVHRPLPRRSRRSYPERSGQSRLSCAIHIQIALCGCAYLVAACARAGANASGRDRPGARAYRVSRSRGPTCMRYQRLDEAEQVIILQHLGPRGVHLCGSTCA